MENNKSNSFFHPDDIVNTKTSSFFHPDDISDEDKEILASAMGTKEPNISAGESFLKGAQQGLTLGHSDELAGATGAALEGATSSPSEGQTKLDQILQAYREYRDPERKQIALAEKQHPGMSFAGNLAGGALIPGGIFGEEAQLAKNLPLKDAVKEITKSGIKTGSKIGSIVGEGTSDTDITNGEPGQLTNAVVDTAKGGLAGAALGPILPLAGAGIKGLAKSTVNEFPTLAKSFDAFKKGLSGEKLTGGELEPAMKELTSFSEEVGNVLTGRKTSAGKALEKSAKKYEELGGSINLDKVDELINRADNILKSPKVPEQYKAEVAKNKNYLEQLKSGVRQEKLVQDYEKVARINQQNQKRFADVQDKIALQNRNSEVVPKVAEEQLKQQAAKIREQTGQDIQFNEPQQIIDSATGKQVASMEETVPSLDQESNNFINDATATLSPETQGIAEETPMKLVQNVIPTDARNIKQITLPSGKKAVEFEIGETGRIKQLPLPEEMQSTPLKTVETREGGYGTNASPTDALRIKQYASRLGYTTDPDKIEAAKLMSSLASDLNNQLQAAPGMSRASNEYSQISNLMSDTFKVAPDDSNEIITQKIADTFDKLTSGELAAKDRIKLQQFLNTVKDIPGVGDKILPKFQALSEKLPFLHYTAQEGFTVLGQVGGKTVSAANILGRSIKGAADTVAGVTAGTTEAISAMVPEDIKKLTIKLYATGGKTGKMLAAELAKLPDKDIRAKQALMFSIMQNPSYRKLLNSYGTTENKDTSNPFEIKNEPGSK